MKWLAYAVGGYLLYKWYSDRQQAAAMQATGQGAPVDFSTIGGGGGGGIVSAPPPAPAPIPMPPQLQPLPPAPSGGTVGDGTGAPAPISHSTPIPGPATDFGPHPSTPITRTVIGPATAAYFDPYHNQPSQTRGFGGGGIGRI
jgi:hypothetical protein